MAQAGEENFPVASRLVGPRRRSQLLAIYGFARLVDDAGDEVAGDRGALLDWIEGDLDRLYAGETPEHPIIRALVPTVRTLDLPAVPFRRLIEASRRDQVVQRYATFRGAARVLPAVGGAGRASSSCTSLERPRPTGSICPTGSAPASSSPSTSRTSLRIARAGGCTCPPRTSTGSAAPTRTSCRERQAAGS